MILYFLESIGNWTVTIYAALDNSAAIAKLLAKNPLKQMWQFSIGQHSTKYLVLKSLLRL